MYEYHVSYIITRKRSVCSLRTKQIDVISVAKTLKQAVGALARLLALPDVIIRPIYYRSFNLDPPICLQTANETVSKGGHRCQHAATGREGRELVQEQRQSRLNHHDRGEQRARVPTALDDRFGVPG